MIKYFVLISIVLLASCNKPDKKLKETISTSDSVAINYFKGDGTMDTVIKVKIVRDKEVINALGTLISAATTKVNYKCGNDGSLHFFKKDVVILDIYFRMNQDSCMLFTFMQSGQTEATIVSQEAKKLLITLSK